MRIVVYTTMWLENNPTSIGDRTCRQTNYVVERNEREFVFRQKMTRGNLDQNGLKQQRFSIPQKRDSENCPSFMKSLLNAISGRAAPTLWLPLDSRGAVFFFDFLTSPIMEMQSSFFPSFVRSPVFLLLCRFWHKKKYNKRNVENDLEIRSIVPLFWTLAGLQFLMRLSFLLVRTDDCKINISSNTSEYWANRKS